VRIEMMGRVDVQHRCSAYACTRTEAVLVGVTILIACLPRVAIAFGASRRGCAVT
jgi:hypothetical protein